MSRAEAALTGRTGFRRLISITLEPRYREESAILHPFRVHRHRTAFFALLASQPHRCILNRPRSRREVSATPPAPGQAQQSPDPDPAAFLFAALACSHSSRQPHRAALRVELHIPAPPRPDRRHVTGTT